MLTASNRRLDQRLLWLLLGIAAALLSYYYYQGWSLALQAPYSLGEEGPALWAAQVLSTGGNPYIIEHLTHHPWRVVTYPPLFFYFGSWFFKITGPHFYSLRWLSMGAFVIGQLAAYRIFSLSGCSRFARILGLTTMACFWTVWSFSYKARVDMVSLCLLILAIEQYLVLARKPKDDNIFRFPRLIVIATLATLAAVTKQGAMVVVPAIAAALIVGRQWRLSLTFMWLSTFLILSSLWLINNVTAGGFFAHQMFVWQTLFTWHDLQKHLSWLGPDAIILPLALLAVPIFVVGYFKRQEERDGPYRQQLASLVLATVLLSLSMVAALFLMGKPTASVSEAIVPMFAASWLVALASDYMRRRLLLLLFLAFGAGFYVMNSLVTDMAQGDSIMESAHAQMLSTNFDKNLMLAEDCGLPIELGAESEFVDLSVFMAVWPKDSPQMRELCQRIAEKKYGAVVINSRDGCLLEPPHYWDRAFVKLLKQNYQPTVFLKDDGRAQDFYLPRRGSTPRH
ncbi:MAG: hypothetical protein JST01_08210 [Cyanobacteria bacterium SZAS TMP-1]|nr:hypothetical protein [Cyanobacteria bacterium SZAS TMP-1]